MSHEAPQSETAPNQWSALLEKPQFDPTSRWQNVNHDRVGFNKAREMAEVEDEYRTKAKMLGEKAAQASMDTGHPLASVGAQMNYEAGMRVVQDGTQAVEAAGQAYDAVPHPGVNLEKPTA
jgi:hypothetical protein